MEPIRCYTCNSNLSDKYDLFTRLREIRINEYLDENDIDINNIQIENCKIKTDDIFDTLNIPPERWCCRMRLTTVTRFNQVVESVILNNV